MKRIATPFSFGSMIDRVNCEGRRVLVKEEAKRRIKLGCAAAGALVAAVLIATCPIPGLSYQATAVLGILIMAIVWWITGVLPEFVTAVVMAVLFVVVAGISVGATFSTFASSTWWLLLSAFTLGVGMKTSGLMRRIALAIVRKFPRTFRCQIIAQLVTGTVLGPLIPSLAVKGAMLAPLAMSIGDELGYERQGKRATGLFAAMLVGIRTVAPTIGSASVTGYALMATLPADVQEQFNMASWFVAALPWLVVVLALNYFLIMGMYGRGEKAGSGSETVGAPGNAQSLNQSSPRCGTRFVGAAEEPLPRLGMPPAKRIPRCRGTRSSFMAESFWGVPSPETRSRLPLLVFPNGAQSRDLFAPPRELVVRGLQVEGQIAQRGVLCHRRERLEADVALPDAGMAVLMRAAGIQAVVQMDGFQPVEADDLVELAHHAVEVSRYVIACVPDMARVQADAHVVGQLHAVDNACDFLERAPDFASFSCHRLE